MPIETGTQIGEYRIDGLLGKGGMAEVYMAWQMNLQRYEALKVLSPQHTHDHLFVERFLNEARTVARLQHPNIAAVFTVSSEGAPQPFFTMEMVDGGDLADLIHTRGRLPLAEALPILRQIAAALDFAHSHGLIHRDIKPANVLLKTEGAGFMVKVVDFGIAKAMEESEGAHLTKTGMFIGTPEYMSPEQAGNGEVVDQHTDQYSLAVLAYEMLCGAPPFRSEKNTSMMSVLMKHVHEEPRPLIDYVPELPTSTNNAILKALAKNAAQRFNSCSEFVAAMEEREPVIVSDTNTNSINTGTKSIFPTAMVAVILVVVIGAALIIAGIMNRNQSVTGDWGVINPMSNQFGGDGSISPPPPPPPQASVPFVVGQTESQARTALGNNSLSVNVIGGYSNTYAAGQVMGQSPKGGSSVDQEKTVTIRVSQGPDPEEQANKQAIYDTVNNWTQTWSQSNLDAYMGNYSPTARIFANQKWYSYAEYYNHERELFAQGGQISINFTGLNTTFIGSGKARVTFHMIFQRWGGRGNHRSEGQEDFRMIKENGRWLIDQDVFTRS